MPLFAGASVAVTLTCKNTQTTGIGTLELFTVGIPGYVPIGGSMSILPPAGWTIVSDGVALEAFSNIAAAVTASTNLAAATKAGLDVERTRLKALDTQQAADQVLLDQQKQNAAADQAGQKTLPFPSANPLYYAGYVTLAGVKY